MGSSPYATSCGKCRKKPLEEARFKHTYSRTHVHVWPDGHKTIESGVTCANQELRIVS